MPGDIRRRRGLWICLIVLVDVVASSGCTGIRATGIEPTGPPTDVPARKVTVIGNDAVGPRASPAVSSAAVGRKKVEAGQKAYRIGEEDELQISVYGYSDLSATQIVRPDGKIAFPLVGDVQASGLSPSELRERLARKLAGFVRDPQVTVVVSEYGSRKVFVLGEVRDPGVVFLASDISVVEAISRAGGTTEEADLRGAMLVRDGQILSVNFERLLRKGDLSHNLQLQLADVILIPNVAARKVYVLGEVKAPIVTSLRYDVSLVESIAMAGGFTRDAEPRNVVVLRGGLVEPMMLTIDVDAITEEGNLSQNLDLESGDIVYVPRSLIADVERFFQRLTTILQPVILAETGIILGPDVESVLTTGEPRTETGVVVGP